MASISDVREHMEIIGADGVHVGTVDRVQGDRIKMTKPDSGSHKSHHHYIPGGLIAGIEGNRVRLSANADNAILFEEEEGGEPLGEQGLLNWQTVGIGAAALAGIAAAAGAYLMTRGGDEGGRKGGSRSNGNRRRSGNTGRSGTKRRSTKAS